MHDTRDADTGPNDNLPAQASNLDALMTEVSLAAGRDTLTVCDHDADVELVAIRPLASRGDGRCSEGDWAAHADAIIFGWLVSP